MLQNEEYVAAGNTEIIGTVTLDVMVGSRVAWTESDNRSIYGWNSFTQREVNASEIPLGTFVEAPSLRWVPNQFVTSFGERLRLEAQGGGRSHFDNIRVWVENY